LFVLDLPKDIYEANTEPMLSHINVGTGRCLDPPNWRRWWPR
jgi:hypothetical protein